MAKFFRRGITRIFWVPTIASLAAPTAAEITAGSELTLLIAAVNGFAFTNQPINTPNLGEAFTTSIPGEDQVAASDFEFYEDKSTNPLMATLAKNTAGYVAIFSGGTAGSGAPATGDKCEVWPMTSTGPHRMYSLGNEAARWQVGFTPTATPATSAVVA